MSAQDREIVATTRWGFGLLIALVVQSGTVFYWAAQVEQQTQQNKNDIEKLELRINAVDNDIRTILVGIEQVKARLGIVEKE